MTSKPDSTSAETLRSALLNRLADLRKAQGWSQAEAAERMGANRMTVVRAESEGADPQLSTFLSMVLALDCRLDLDSNAAEANPDPSTLIHKGLHHVRTKRDAQWRDTQREKAFAEAWQAVNQDRRPGPSPVLPLLIPHCTQAQASAAATAMQWLGSDVGFDFLTRTLQAAGYTISDTRTKP